MTLSEEDLAVALREGTPAPPAAPDRAVVLADRNQGVSAQ